ncbi:hypothetical protein J6590_041186 [Homalodisca vitripennis]|nr:hypothetical protein J6590_041186 [Homalodisca vitripennis]
MCLYTLPLCVDSMDTILPTRARNFIVWLLTLTVQGYQLLPVPVSRTGATLALTWALMELFWTNEKAAMAARPRPLPPSPPPSNTPRPLLDPLAASPPPYESDGGRAMADGVMADEQKFVSPAADCRADHWTTETSCAWRRDMAVRAARGARRYRRSACCYLVETAYNMLVAASEDVKKSMPTVTLLFLAYVCDFGAAIW